MDHYDKVVRDRCCRLSDKEKLNSGLITQRQVKDAIKTYKNPATAQYFAGEYQLLNQNIKAELLTSPGVKQFLGVKMPIPENIPIRPVPTVVRVIEPDNEEGRILERANDQREDDLRETLIRQQSISEELQEVSAELKEKYDRGDTPLPEDLDRVTRLEKELERANKKIVELEFQVQRGKVQEKTLAEFEAEALEEAEQQRIRAESERKLRSLQNQPVGTLRDLTEILSEEIGLRNVEVSPEKRVPPSQIKQMGRQRLVEYLTGPLGFDIDELFLQAGLEAGGSGE